MIAITRDPLLAIAKGILWFLMGCMIVGAAACLLAMPLLHMFKADITIEMTKEVPYISVPDFLWLATGALACVVVLLLILFRIFQLLARIVRTVGEGDPFVPENAARLKQMAWLALGVQLISFVLDATVEWVEHTAGDVSDVHKDINIDGGLSGNGLLLMLILFILARVFRQGAAMRAELEGTV